MTYDYTNKSGTGQDYNENCSRRIDARKYFGVDFDNSKFWDFVRFIKGDDMVFLRASLFVDEDTMIQYCLPLTDNMQSFEKYLISGDMADIQVNENIKDFQKFLMSGDEKDLPEGYNQVIDTYENIYFIKK